MRTVLVLSAFAAVSLAIPHPVTIDQEWHEYKKSFGKFYTSADEDGRRLNQYLITKLKVEEHNRKHERGEKSFKKGINQFADWFPEEIDKFNSLKVDKGSDSANRKVFELAPGTEVPEEINWVEKGVVTAVKNQGHCGSCYAFRVGALEGMWYLQNNTLTDLSEQELVDCSLPEGNNGCSGGFMYECFEYVIQRNGISTYKSYPYTATDRTCRADNGTIGATCSSYVQLPPGEDALKKAVGTVAPISISFAVAQDFIFYHGGIYDGTVTLRRTTGCWRLVMERTTKPERTIGW